ncbi:hypothetical protein BWD42_12905 [Sphingobacterium sp. CZ-UAM]|uniref:RNA polymerase sigma factor n=1 Tax=Sphingobacterium sp. CZ-UAM TaxID=1933868 RepID=UPI000984F0C0|nr:sigma-70 family RNA polymerase sigma factor [Sphingobacterium sp. CZ-UAM]OOG18161.1 hypothetical protein BWD42_12905 [Sphingobacterium sp. CZ-UAM]
MKKEYFKDLFNRYHKKVFLFVQYYIESQDDAADVVQEVFIHLWRYVHKLYGVSNPEAIIFKTSKQEIANFYRKQKVQFTSLDSAYELTEIEERFDESAYQIKVDKLNLLLSALPERRKIMVLDSVVDELSYSEIAHKFKISKTAVAKQINKAMAFLRANF